VKRHSFQTGSVNVYQCQIEISFARVGRKMFVQKIIRFPSGVKYGANEAVPSFVTWRLFVPSAFIVQISKTVGSINFS
jgi:hypothetical protein